MGLFDFFASAPANSPTSYQGMEARRKIAERILANSRKGYPKNIGEGLTAIGDAIGDRGVMSQLAEQEAAYQKQAAAVFGEGGIPPEARTPGPQSAVEPSVRSAYAPEASVQPTSTAASFRPAPAYLQAALEEDVADPERRAYLGHLAGKEAQSADEVSSTGAAGPFQFTRGTGAQYGLMQDGQDMRGDIHGSIAAVQNLTDDNAATLTKMLGRQPSPNELALAHQQGAVTAGRMLTGAGNAPARNLAVNNVNPAASPQAAAARIMNYYNMPNPGRDAIATQLTARTAQGGPQPNPTSAVADLSAALPFSGSPTAPGGALPPEITSGASAIRPAPPLPSPITAAPQQVAQATSPQREQPPQEQKMHPVEVQGWQMMRKARALGDPNLIAQAESLIKYGADKNKQQYDLAVKDYQDRLLLQRQRELAEEAFAREAPERKLRMAKDAQGILTQQPPNVPPTQMAGSGVPGGGDPRLGTDQSPQRTGVPVVPPTPPGMSPQQWADRYKEILPAAVEAERKATPEFKQSLELIKGLQDHPGRTWIGAGMKIAGQIPGTDAYAFQQRLEQMKGRTFLQAYQTLKGGGSITEIEGSKATQALARLDAAQSPKEFDTALNDLEKTLRSDLELAQRKVNKPVTAWQSTSNDQYAPDIGQRRGNKEYIGGSPSDPASWRTIQ